MKKKYTRKQICEAIKHWKKELKKMDEASWHMSKYGAIERDIEDDFDAVNIIIAACVWLEHNGYKEEVKELKAWINKMQSMRTPAPGEPLPPSTSTNSPMYSFG